MDVPVVSGNWGPPMSHAANSGGRLRHGQNHRGWLGAKDFQYALDRALLHGDLEIARWLHEQGAVFTPGVIMGSCETLNERGFVFLDDAGVPLMDARGSVSAACSLVLETYSRNPTGKHAILQRFRERGYQWADTPVMAFHCGDPDRLKVHLTK